MVKIIRRPVTDIYWQDLITLEKVENNDSIDSYEEHSKKTMEEFKKKKKREDWKIYVNWLGRVK